MAARLQEPGRAITAGSSSVARSRYHGIFQLCYVPPYVSVSLSLFLSAHSTCVFVSLKPLEISSHGALMHRTMGIVWYGTLLCSRERMRKHTHAHINIHGHANLEPWPLDFGSDMKEPELLLEVEASARCFYHYCCGCRSRRSTLAYNRGLNITYTTLGFLLISIVQFPPDPILIIEAPIVPIS